MYRPISNLKSASKILEMIVNYLKYQVMKYMEANKLFPHGQHGFRANRSTFSALANMQETWLKAYESGHNISITLFDLSSAFDTISKEVFCRKLEIYGFDKTSVKWFDSYLSNRSQITMIGSSKSKKLELNIGTPQGAILSPTIFIILVSDLQLWTKGMVSSYADDTTSTTTNENTQKLISHTEHEGKKILEYMSLNCLFENEDKQPSY